VCNKKAIPPPKIPWSLPITILADLIFPANGAEILSMLEIYGSETCPPPFPQLSSVEK
jgi:hypothetical protein